MESKELNDLFEANLIDMEQESKRRVQTIMEKKGYPNDRFDTMIGKPSLKSSLRASSIAKVEESFISR